MSDIESLKTKLQETEDELNELRKEFDEYLTSQYNAGTKMLVLGIKSKLANMKIH